MSRRLFRMPMLFMLCLFSMSAFADAVPAQYGFTNHPILSDSSVMPGNVQYVEKTNSDLKSQSNHRESGGVLGNSIESGEMIKTIYVITNENMPSKLTFCHSGRMLRFLPT